MSNRTDLLWIHPQLVPGNSTPSKTSAELAWHHPDLLALLQPTCKCDSLPQKHRWHKIVPMKALQPDQTLIAKMGRPMPTCQMQLALRCSDLCCSHDFRHLWIFKVVMTANSTCTVQLAFLTLSIAKKLNCANMAVSWSKLWQLQ